MRKAIKAAIITALLLTSTMIAGESPATEAKVKFQNIEASLLNGIKSENNGLQVSSAQMLGEIKSDKAVIPLMSVLRENESEPARIAAALSLYKIGDARGINAVRQSARFDNSKRVRHMCATFYSEYKSNQ